MYDLRLRSITQACCLFHLLHCETVDSIYYLVVVTRVSAYHKTNHVQRCSLNQRGPMRRRFEYFLLCLDSSKIRGMRIWSNLTSLVDEALRIYTPPVVTPPYFLRSFMQSSIEPVVSGVDDEALAVTERKRRVRIHAFRFACILLKC